MPNYAVLALILGGLAGIGLGRATNPLLGFATFLLLWWLSPLTGLAAAATFTVLVTSRRQNHPAVPQDDRPRLSNH